MSEFTASSSQAYGATTPVDADFLQEIAEFVVSNLNLDIPANQIDADAALYGDGLGLDSIDVLELALAISKKYGFQLKSDDPQNPKTFSSLRSLAQFIADNRQPHSH